MNSFHRSALAQVRESYTKGLAASARLGRRTDPLTADATRMLRYLTDGRDWQEIVTGAFEKGNTGHALAALNLLASFGLINADSNSIRITNTGFYEAERAA